LQKYTYSNLSSNLPQIKIQKPLRGFRAATLLVAGLIRIRCMSDPLTLTVGALVTLATHKFVESNAGELAKKFTTYAIAKMPELWQQIKNKLQGKPAKVDEAFAALLQKSAQGM